MDFIDLNIQLQRLPNAFLIQMAKQYGIHISIEQIANIKSALQQHIHSISSVKDIERILRQHVNEATAKQFIALFVQYFK